MTTRAPFVPSGPGLREGPRRGIGRSPLPDRAARGVGGGAVQALLRGEDERGRPGPWWRFRRPSGVLVAARPEEVPALLGEVEAAAGAGRWAVGFVAYEAAPGFDRALVTRELPPGLPAAWFGLFDAPETIARGPADGGGGSAGGLAAEASVPEREYLAAIAAIRAAIARGETYQANYTYRLRGRLVPGGAGPADAWALFARLVGAQGNAAYAAFLELGERAICSVSPELFFRRHGREVVCRPMKGTAARGRTPNEDRTSAAALLASAKDRAENVMIVDMTRNDLGRVARAGSVAVRRLFDVERYPSLFQLTSEVAAETSAPLPELFAALFPCASITGAPKVRTMELIAGLETTPRGIYTGAVGFVAPGGRARFSVAIRTACVAPSEDGRPGLAFEYGTGGGVVWDSSARSELAESRTKALVLTREEPRFELLETFLWEPRRRYRLLERHLDRMAASAGYFDFPFDAEEARRRLGEEGERLPPRRHKVRLLCDREGRLRIETAALESRRRPWRVVLARHPVDARDRFLFHKTTRRQVYDEALAEARATESAIDDVILWNCAGELTESTVANLVLDLGGDLVTPPVAAGLLAGTFRAELLARGRIRERLLAKEDLERADSIFLVSSVRGWIPVHAAAGKRAERPAPPGPEARREPATVR